MLGETPVLAPRLTSWLIKLLGGRNVIGIKSWESREIGGVTITAVPAVHMTVTVGYVLESENQRVFFAGDTFYSGFMKKIGERFRIDVALMPVTTYRIPMTMSDKGAVKAVQMIKPGVVIPIHLGIIPRSPILRTSQTPEQFTQRLKDSGATAKVVLLREGESYEIG